MDYRSTPGFDRTRNVVIGNKNFDLTYLEEAYTTEHWLVRIYRLVQEFLCALLFSTIFILSHEIDFYFLILAG